MKWKQEVILKKRTMNIFEYEKKETFNFPKLTYPYLIT